MTTKKSGVKKLVSTIVFAVLAIVVVSMSSRILETNEDGYFQVKQAVITGDMSVRSTGGTYMQNFGTIWTYKNVASVGFGKEVDEASAIVPAIPVIFNDGSKADISGFIRVKLPLMEDQRIQLKTEYPRGFEHFITNGIVPIVKNAVKLSANLRSAQDAYTTLALFQQAVDDQLENGTYVTRSDKVEVVSSTGDREVRQVTVIALDDNGNPKRIPNRLQELGCEIAGCVIDVPEFDNKVTEMIARRKDEAMKTELAKQEAIRAKQDAITAEEQGKANVAKAKYEEEVVKAKAVTKAQKEYEVAQLNAKKALEEKKKIVAQGQAQAEANRLKVAAGLTPQERAEWNYKTKVGIAAELAKRDVPKIVMNGEEGSGSGLSNSYTMENMILLMDKLDKKGSN